jgi:hypothetical protein
VLDVLDAGAGGRQSWRVLRPDQALSPSGPFAQSFWASDAALVNSGSISDILGGDS